MRVWKASLTAAALLASARGWAAPSSFDLENAALRVRVDVATLGFTVFHARTGKAWRAPGPARDSVRIREGDRRAVTSLSSALRRNVRRAQEGVWKGRAIELRGFVGDGLTGGALTLVFLLHPSAAEMRVSVEAMGEEPVIVEAAHYPAPFALARSPGDQAVVPLGQGVLLPGDGRQAIALRGEFGSARLPMPWFGGLSGRSGYVAILEDPHDAALAIRSPVGGPPALTLEWLPVWRSIGRARRVRYAFLSDATHVALARRYRAYVQARGAFRSLAQKGRTAQSVRRLAVRPWVDLSVVRATGPGPAARVLEARFADHQRQLRSAAARGLRAAVRLCGWNLGGMDALYPRFLPPSEEAGGWAGLRALAASAAAADHLLGLHLNFVPFFHDAPGYRAALTLLSEEGKRVQRRLAGGPAGQFCDRLAAHLVRSTVTELVGQGVRPAFVFMDEYGSRPLDECYDERHPMTRRDCAETRSELLGLVGSLTGSAVAIAGGADWALPNVDQVLCEAGAGKATAPLPGIPVPLYGLVYHDAVVLYQPVATRSDAAVCALYGASPRLTARCAPRLPPPDSTAVKLAAALADVQARVAGQPLLDHRFVTPDRSRQETRFGNGVRVRADLRAGTWRVGLVSPR